MGRVPITVMGFRCERCGHEWVPRDPEATPKVCPKCKSPYWDRPNRKPLLSYAEFRDQTQKVLRRAAKPITWTEIRTAAGFPQLYPNNAWVRRMERDINLVRERDPHGIMQWRLGERGTEQARCLATRD